MTEPPSQPVVVVAQVDGKRRRRIEYRVVRVTGESVEVVEPSPVDQRQVSAGAGGDVSRAADRDGSAEARG